MRPDVLLRLLRLGLDRLFRLFAVRRRHRAAYAHHGAEGVFACGGLPFFHGLVVERGAVLTRLLWARGGFCVSSCALRRAGGETGSSMRGAADALLPARRRAVASADGARRRWASMGEGGSSPTAARGRHRRLRGVRAHAARRNANQFVLAQHGAAVEFKVLIGLFLAAAALLLAAGDAAVLQFLAHEAHKAAQPPRHRQTGKQQHEQDEKAQPLAQSHVGKAAKSAPSAPPPTPRS